MQKDFDECFKRLVEGESLQQEVTMENDRHEAIEIPTLVVELLLDWIKNVNLLATCRLVNKYWNGLACTSLQKNSITTLEEGRKWEGDEGRFNDFLKLQVPGSTAPSPFRNHHIVTTGFVKEPFYNFVLNENIVTTKLTIDINEKEPDMHRLYEFLKAKQQDLITLNIKGDYHGVLSLFYEIKLPLLPLLFPKLHHLTLFCPNDVDNVVTEERFPALRSLKLQRCKTKHIESLTSVSHCVQSVRTLDICIPHQVDMEGVFQTWMTNLAKKFPNVDGFSLQKKLWYPSTILSIHQAYPNLKTLKIGECKGIYEALSGTTKEKVREYLSVETSLKDLPRGPSILDFKELESLAFDEIHDNDIISHCLAFMTNVKYLEITEYPGFSPSIVQVMADNLKHLKKLKFTNAPTQLEIDLLQRALPDCEVSCVHAGIAGFYEESGEDPDHVNWESE